MTNTVELEKILRIAKAEHASGGSNSGTITTSGQVYTWKVFEGQVWLSPGTPKTTPSLSRFVDAYEAYVGQDVGYLIYIWETFILTGADLSFYCTETADGLHEVEDDDTCIHCGTKYLV